MLRPDSVLQVRMAGEEQAPRKIEALLGSTTQDHLQPVTRNFTL